MTKVDAKSAPLKRLFDDDKNEDVLNTEQRFVAENFQSLPRQRALGHATYTPKICLFHCFCLCIIIILYTLMKRKTLSCPLVSYGKVSHQKPSPAEAK